MDVVNTVVLGVLVSAVGLILARITKGGSSSLQRNVGVLRQDVVGIREDVVGLGQDVVGLGQDVLGLGQGFARLRQDVAGLRQEFVEFRTEIKADLRATEQRLDGRIDGLQRTVDGMRSDLTQVALAVGVKPRASNG